jgi:hypothetical protein
MGQKVNQMNRFQNQKWYVKLWRLRLYFLIPIYTLRFYFKSDCLLSLKNAYKLAKGIVQSDMNWVFTTEEVFGKREEAFGKNYSFSIFFNSPLEDVEIADKVYENGCDDAMFGRSNGLYSLCFDRCETSLSNAIGSALYNIECSKIDAKIIRIEVD